MRRGAALSGPAPVLGALGLDTSLDSLEGSAHQAVNELTAAAEAQGLAWKVRSTRRSCAQQADLFAVGRQPDDTRKVVTKARGCTSWHVTGRAIDVTMTQGTYEQLGALAKSMGWKWGGDFPGFPDVGHVEWHPGMTTADVCPDPMHCEDSNVDTTLPGGPPGPQPLPGTPDDSGSSDEGTSPLVPVILGLAAFTAIYLVRS